MNDVEALFERARSLADALLFEGYVLYPYRASAAKNQLRWQFGVLTPPSYAALDNGERSASRCECLLEPGQDAELVVRLRLLHVVQREVTRRSADAGYQPVDSLRVGDTVWVPWAEATTEAVDLRVPVAELLASGPRRHQVSLPGGQAVEAIEGADAQLQRCWWPLTAEVSITAEQLPGPYGALRLRLDVANTCEWDPQGAPRDEALRHSLVAAHTLLGLTEGHFLSLADPPEWASGYAKDAVNDGVWPALLGDGAVMLASPIIIDDDARTAPESPGDLYDGLEIDEILTLRTMTLTEQEKAEARGTDARAAAVINRADHLPPEVLERLHGAIRSLRSATGEPAGSADPTDTAGAPWWQPGADDSVAPDSDTVEVDGVAVGRGAQVQLAPDLRGADAQDFLLVGRTATVAAVLLDVDGDTHVAVTLDDDPGADLADATGRYRYFRPTELRVPAGRR